MLSLFYYFIYLIKICLNIHKFKMVYIYNKNMVYNNNLFIYVLFYLLFYFFYILIKNPFDEDSNPTWPRLCVVFMTNCSNELLQAVVWSLLKYVSIYASSTDTQNMPSYLISSFSSFRDWPMSRNDKWFCRPLVSFPSSICSSASNERLCASSSLIKLQLEIVHSVFTSNMRYAWFICVFGL